MTETRVPDQDPLLPTPGPIDVDGRPVVLDRPSPAASGRFVSPTARISRGDRGSTLIAGATVVFLALALVKPWNGPGDGPRPAAPAIVAASAGPTPSPTPDLTDLRRHCQEPLGWRVYSREGRNRQALRAWRSVEPAEAADGPLDPRIPVVQLGPGIEALGYCSPWTGPERPAATATVSAWRLLPERRGEPWLGVTLRRIEPARATPLGALFGPLIGPEPAPQPGRGWPAGRYVFALKAPGWERWWAVEIAEPPVDPTAASPPETSGTDGSGSTARP